MPRTVIQEDRPGLDRGNGPLVAAIALVVLVLLGLLLYFGTRNDNNSNGSTPNNDVTSSQPSSDTQSTEPTAQPTSQATSAPSVTSTP